MSEDTVWAAGARFSCSCSPGTRGIGAKVGPAAVPVAALELCLPNAGIVAFATTARANVLCNSSMRNVYMEHIHFLYSNFYIRMLAYMSMPHVCLLPMGLREGVRPPGTGAVC